MHATRHRRLRATLIPIGVATHLHAAPGTPAFIPFNQVRMQHHIWAKRNLQRIERTLPDTDNTVHPAEPPKVRRLRIEMQPQHDQSCVGILSVNLKTTTD